MIPEKLCGIYEISNIVNKNIYIGSSNNINKRIKEHFKMLENNKHHSDYLQNAYNKYGKDNFIGKPLIICHTDMLLFYEQQFLDSWHPEYNMSGIAGRVEETEEVRYKQSISGMGNQNGKGYKFTDEQRDAVSVILKGNQYAKGHERSEEHKKAISNGSKGLKRSEEHKKAISVYMKGREKSESHKKSLSEANKGHKIPEWQRKATSMAMKGKQNALGYKFTDEQRKKRSDIMKDWWKNRKESQNTVNIIGNEDAN